MRNDEIEGWVLFILSAAAVMFLAEEWTRGVRTLLDLILGAS